EQDTVVVGVGLGTKDGDLIVIGGNLEQLFERADAGHAVANQDQFELFHYDPRAWTRKQKRRHSCTAWLRGKTPLSWVLGPSLHLNPAASFGYVLFTAKAVPGRAALVDA